jgi:glycosyltransferase involved in cell wall biosynthesis
LIPRLVKIAPEHDWVILRHSSNRKRLVGGAAEEVFIDLPIDGPRNFLTGSRAYGHVFERSGTPDVIHSLFHILPRGIDPGIRVVVTAHDFIWIDHPEISQKNAMAAWTMRRFARRAIPYALQRADRVIAVSQATADRAAAWVAPEAIEVIPHGVEPRYFEPPPPADPIIDYLRADGARYLLAVGNDKHYKNLHTLIRAFAAVAPRFDRLRLALVGRCEALEPLADELGVSDRVAFLGFLEDEDLRRVYGNASCFVFGSLVEGFGLPPLEAMAMGVPTIVSDLEPMRSVVADGALRFEPTDVAALAELLRQVLGDSRVAQNLSETGRLRARTFDWDETAARTLEVLWRG